MADKPLTVEEIQAETALTLDMLTVKRIVPVVAETLGEGVLTRLCQYAVEGVFKAKKMDRSHFQGPLIHRLARPYLIDATKKIDKIIEIKAANKQVNEQWIVPAPVAIGTLVVKNFRQVTGGNRDTVAKNFNKWNLWKYIPIAIQAYRPTKKKTFKIKEALNVPEGTIQVLNLNAAYPTVITLKQLSNPAECISLLADDATDEPGDEDTNRPAVTGQHTQADRQAMTGPKRRGRFVQVSKTITREDAVKSAGQLTTEIGVASVDQQALLPKVKDWLTPNRYAVLEPEFKNRVACYCMAKKLKVCDF
ncbi:Fc.00g088470.m01.CDS01 [Cosmosporella sp. VM-42]